MSEIDDVFRHLRASGERAMMPFITAGDPDVATTLRLIERFEALGCHLCEVGIPYSDPIADGPVIQASYSRALGTNAEEDGFRLQQLFDVLPSRNSAGKMPLVAMVSFAIVWRYGIERFVASARQAGFAGAIVPDCPLGQSPELESACRQADFSFIQLVAPTTPFERAIEIARQSTGFIYYVAVTGTTGQRVSAPNDVLDTIGKLRQHTDLPICLGFGISRPEHVEAVGADVDGVIVGSAIVRTVEQAAEQSGNDTAPIVHHTVKYVESMLSAVEGLK